MFAYCNNNPILLVDSCGYASKICLVDNSNLMQRPWQDAGGGGGIDIRRIFPEKIYKTQSLDFSFLETPFEILRALINNFEFSVGVGGGCYGETTLLDFVSAEAGMACDILSLRFQDGSWTVGQEFRGGFKFTGLGYNFGYEEYSFNRLYEPAEIVRTSEWWEDDSWTIISEGWYFMVGGSFRIGYDLSGLCEDLDKIIYGE